MDNDGAIPGIPATTHSVFDKKTGKHLFDVKLRDLALLDINGYVDLVRLLEYDSKFKIDILTSTGIHYRINVDHLHYFDNNIINEKNFLFIYSLFPKLLISLLNKKIEYTISEQVLKLYNESI